MVADAGNSLTAGEVKTVLRRLEEVVEREACWSCECLQDFISRLELNADGEAKSLLEMYKVRPERLHGTLGCQPCAPAELFGDYPKTT